MTYILKYFDEVELDVHVAKVWYKEQKEGFEIAFADSIANAIAHIVEMPKMYSIRYKNIRVAHPKIFPYNIYFYIDEPNATVVIIAIVHSKRHPRVAKRRV
ncbi:MAG: type II toxin-antitoxin system RelE/ParE family toxin [Breznakibacter sp.]|nr:type II toxin-antitoxin system RelE/ParE family toxin [Breznakibacter sp.]